MIFYEVRPEDSKIRIDKLLAMRFSDYSRQRIQELLKEGSITVDGLAIKKYFYANAGSKIAITPKESSKRRLAPSKMDLNILYEDSDILVLNKPQGIATHPATFEGQHSIANGVVHYCNELPHMQSIRPGIVHRLDKDTSGVLVIAKNSQAHANIAKQFEERTVQKQYLALGWGQTKFLSDSVVETFIERDNVIRSKWKITHDKGKRAKSVITYLFGSKQLALFLVVPHTGRTHQIRLHMEHIGSPIIGDKLYGRSPFNVEGQLLHAYKLAFVHPTTEKIVTFKAPLPPYFTNFMRDKCCVSMACRQLRHLIKKSWDKKWLSANMKMLDFVVYYL